MPVVQPPKERHSIQDIGSSLKVTIPSRKNYFILFFLGFGSWVGPLAKLWLAEC
jgi:hypothetical protein